MILNKSRYNFLVLVIVCIVYLILVAISKIINLPEFIYFLVFVLSFFLFPRLLISSFKIYWFYFFLFSLGYAFLNYFFRLSDLGAIFPFAFILFSFGLYFFRISGSDYNNLIYIFFILYFFLSLFFYFWFEDIYRHIAHPILNIRNFHGVEGTPASIDAFSALVIIYFFASGRFSTLSVVSLILAIITIFLCASTTPILMLIVSILGYLYFKVFRSKTIFFVVFIVANALLLYSYYFFQEYFYLIDSATNGRAGIWASMIQNLDARVIFLGDTLNSVVDISWGKGSTSNPHNGFLFIVIRFGLLYLLVLLIFLVIKIRGLTKKNVILVTALLSCAISNSNIFYIGNPIYLISLFAFLENDEI